MLLYPKKAAAKVKLGPAKREEGGVGQGVE